MHFTPTYSSWLNQVELWFGLLTDKKLRRGAHRSIQALENDIRDWITTLEPKPATIRLDQVRSNRFDGKRQARHVQLPRRQPARSSSK